MNTLPAWFSVAWATIAVLGVLGGACAFAFIMVPYMRRTEALLKGSALTADVNKEKVNAVLAAIEGLPGRLEALSKKGVRSALEEL